MTALLVKLPLLNSVSLNEPEEAETSTGSRNPTTVPSAVIVSCAFKDSRGAVGRVAKGISTPSTACGHTFGSK